MFQYQHTTECSIFEKILNHHFNQLFIRLNDFSFRICMLNLSYRSGKSILVADVVTLMLGLDINDCIIPSVVPLSYQQG